MFTIVASRTTMNCARQTIARTSQRLVVRAFEACGNSKEADRAVRLPYHKWSDPVRLCDQIT